jgi:hypothetical protein
MKKILVNFRVEADMWQVFKLLLLKKTQIRDSKTGVMVPTTPSWNLRQWILEYILEEADNGHLKSLIKELEADNPAAPVLNALHKWQEIAEANQLEATGETEEQ